VVKDILNCVAFTNSVGRVDPFHCPAEFASNPLPTSVTVATEPCATVEGDRAVSVGVGAFTGKSNDSETAGSGSGFCTVRLAVRPLASALAGITAVSEVALLYVVGYAVASS
jgi:hypothetical protein